MGGPKCGPVRRNLARFVLSRAVRLVRHCFCPFDYDEEELDDRRVTFTTKNASKTSYRQFIEALRAQLASGEEPHGIPVMREPSTVPDYRRFVLVKLKNRSKNRRPDFITVAVDVTNAYVVAYRAGSRSFFLRAKKPNSAIVNLFPGTNRNDLTFSGSYRELEKVAGKTRADTALGMKELRAAITELRTSNLDQQKCLAHSLIVVIQMVAEAVRFKPIENLVCDSFRRYRRMIPSKLDATMLEYENNWKRMSKAIQQPDEVGVISSPVAIMLFVRRTGQP